MSVLEVDGLRTSIRLRSGEVRAVDGVSFSVEPGVAVTGELPSAMHPPSGCRFRTRCRLAQEICAEQEPPLRPFGGGHVAACHFPLQTPAAARPGR